MVMMDIARMVREHPDKAQAISMLEIEFKKFLEGLHKEGLYFSLREEELMKTAFYKGWAICGTPRE
jgi:hypothetical protein